MSLEKTQECMEILKKLEKNHSLVVANYKLAERLCDHYIGKSWSGGMTAEEESEYDECREIMDEFEDYRCTIRDSIEHYVGILYDVNDGLYWRHGRKIMAQKEAERIKRARKAHDYSNEPIVCYMLTFTLNKKNVTRHAAAERLIRNIPLRSSIGFEILEMRLVRETHKSGAYHWHVGLQVRGIIKKDRFKGYIDSFGMVDIKRQKTSDSLDGPMSTYCSKENPFEIVYQKP